MSTKLSRELADALRASGGSELEVFDPDSQRTYVLVDRDTHRRAMEALRRQQDRDAIAQGISEMETGHGVSTGEARRLTREKILAPKQ